ncbi:glycogen synthase GlgA [Bacillus sp. HSf4]|uniref:glycogen synthase GlgA n=1 Tax=Bacillus sp. HSf4 TaxID=3035514 RepID=UPI002409BE07|nr:glycogen synthase GlgA [Bacillus sp. HSf4]WFA04263.1 glycogen synthase GlgA [Bacillus sp. HSf4]
MKIISAVSKCAPFVKSGGLADVAGALPKELSLLGIETAVIMPKYSLIAEGFRKRMAKIAECEVSVGWRRQYCGIEVLEHDGVSYYFIDNEYYFKRDTLYGHDDDGERFAFFSRAVLEALYTLDMAVDVIHTHDWHAAMINYLLKEDYGKRPFYQNMKTVFTIHNLQFQGIFPKEAVSDLLGLDFPHFTPETLEFYGNVNYMKGGIIAADQVTTVSPTYRDEILTPYYGERLEGVLSERRHVLTGILNGIDESVYDPLYDPDIDYHYDAENRAGKRKNKAVLQQMMGLPEREDIPVVGMVTRLTKQKGIDLIKRVLHELFEEEEMQLIVLGSGETEFENYFRYMEYAYPEQCRAHIGFSEQRSRKIYAGSDLFLMPSKFEPCGLGQLIALKYGAVPIVRETGGLNDTVSAFQEKTGEGNGFTFAHFNAHDMKHTIKRALFFYRQKGVWNGIVQKGMTQDVSWAESARRYQRIFDRVIKGDASCSRAKTALNNAF